MTDKIVVRTNIHLKPNDMDTLRRSILKQAEDGVIVVPWCCEILYPDEKILEQIRAEIADEKMDIDLDIGQEIHYNRAIDDVLAIIDKYIGQKESE